MIWSGMITAIAVEATIVTLLKVLLVSSVFIGRLLPVILKVQILGVHGFALYHYESQE